MPARSQASVRQLKVLCESYLIAQLKLFSCTAQLTVPCIASCPLLLQAALAELNGLLLSLAVPAVLNSLLLHFSVLHSLHLFHRVLFRSRRTSEQVRRPHSTMMMVASFCLVLLA